MQVIAAALAMVDGKILEALNIPLDTEVEVSIITPFVFHSGLSPSLYHLALLVMPSDNIATHALCGD
jgi:hypothetical protein